MSKAFTREDDGADADDDGADEARTDDFSERAPLPAGGKNYVTPTGWRRLKEELGQLLNVERPKVVETVAWAAGNGDRSENADYIYGKRRLREIDRRVRFLQGRLDLAEVVDPAQQKSERVLFGATVEVKDEAGEVKHYAIVGIDEADAKLGRVSWRSPIGQALLQAKVGDSVTVHTPKGEEELVITKIQFLAID